jgi:hypothetical protein
MIRISATLFLLAGTLSLAQAPAAVHSESNSSPVVLKSIPNGTECPIGFRADRLSTAQVLSAADVPKNGHALGLHLTLDHRTAPTIESIEVTVYGISQRGRIVPTDIQATTSDTRDTVSKTFSLHRTADSENLTDTDVWMHKVGALRWADLNEVQYADGTTWHPSGSAKCRAIPDNYVLAGQR